MTDFEAEATKLIPPVTPPEEYAAMYAEPPEVQDAQRLVNDLSSLSEVAKKAAYGFILGSLLQMAQDPDTAERAINILRTAKNFTTPQIMSPDEASVEPVEEADRLLAAP